MGYGHGWTKRGLSARFGSNFREPLAPTNLPQADLTGRVRRPAETPPRGGPRVESAWVWKTGSRFNPPHHTSDGLCATADLGSSFYSSFGGLTVLCRHLLHTMCHYLLHSLLGVWDMRMCHDVVHRWRGVRIGGCADLYRLRFAAKLLTLILRQRVSRCRRFVGDWGCHVVVSM